MNGIDTFNLRLLTQQYVLFILHTLDPCIMQCNIKRATQTPIYLVFIRYKVLLFLVVLTHDYKCGYHQDSQ